jgi:hypothetical protein
MKEAVSLAWGVFARRRIRIFLFEQVGYRNATVLPPVQGCPCLSAKRENVLRALRSAVAGRNSTVSKRLHGRT